MPPNQCPHHRPTPGKRSRSRRHRPTPGKRSRSRRHRPIPDPPYPAPDRHGNPATTSRPSHSPSPRHVPLLPEDITRGRTPNSPTRLPTGRDAPRRAPTRGPHKTTSMNPATPGPPRTRYERCPPPTRYAPCPPPTTYRLRLGTHRPLQRRNGFPRQSGHRHRDPRPPLHARQHRIRHHPPRRPPERPPKCSRSGTPRRQHRSSDAGTLGGCCGDLTGRREVPRQVPMRRVAARPRMAGRTRPCQRRPMLPRRRLP